MAVNTPTSRTAERSSRTLERASRTLERGTRSRERILDVASRLMADRGYAATSIAQICEAAGLPPSSLYWHFGSKEELLGAVMERGAERWFSDLPSWHDLPGDPETRLASRLDLLARRLESHPEFLRLYILLSIERREIDASSLAPIRRIRDRAIGGVRAILVDVFGGAEASSAARELASELARFVICFCDGCFVSHQVEPTATDLRRLFDHLRVGLLAIARARLGAATDATLRAGTPAKRGTVTRKPPPES
jgi:AcrR family transcriptional regulator